MDAGVSESESEDEGDDKDRDRDHKRAKTPRSRLLVPDVPKGSIDYAAPVDGFMGNLPARHLSRFLG